MQTEVAELGRIVSIEGSGATARLAWEPRMGEDDEASLTVGHLVGIRRGASLVVATVVRMTTEPAPDTSSEPDLIAKLDFMGEVRNYGTNDVFFQRGVSNYPIIGSQVVRLRSEDISVIHRISGSRTVHIGQLRLDDSIPAYVNFQELLCKHFAIVGTTGVGKSSTVALILQQILEQNADLRIFLIDPHNEYGNCFGDKAHVISPRNLSLPFWLFNFEEMIDVIFRSRPGVEEEMELLQELIPIAKARYAVQSRGERVGIRKMDNGGFTADTPVPYRIVDLVSLINDQVGKLENRSVSVKFHRLIGRIETLGNDSRYAFMFNNSHVQDIMADVLTELFCLPPSDKTITVMHLAGFPAEVIDSVVSVLCRMAFEFGVWSNGTTPILVACEEAHRYATADSKLGFGPTRKALSRIAKEGRKYGTYLGVITQRPADLDVAILSQCSTVFAMRLADERDKAIVKSAVPDAGAGLIDFLSSLGNREAIAFGEGVPLPMRVRFTDLPDDRLPRSQSGVRGMADGGAGVDADSVDDVVSRWRAATSSKVKSKSRVRIENDALDDGELADDDLGAQLVQRRSA